MASRAVESQTAPEASSSGRSVLDTQARIRSAVDRVLPNVVLVLADTEERRNVGSGVVVSPNGHILTNSHVVRGATEVSIVLANGNERPARLIADDWPYTDSAMLQVAPQNLRQVAFGSSAALKPGDLVISVSGGTGAFGGGNAVSLGVVSGINRYLPRAGHTLEDLIQTDAAVNNGDSGGALINLSGEFVGLTTTLIREGPGGVEITNVGFAQAADALRPIAGGMISNGTFPRNRPGIEMPDEQHLEISSELAARRQLPVQAGALIVAPAPNSPAARAGIVAGDIVAGVNGVAISFDLPLVNILKRVPRGQRLDLAIIRDGRTLTVQIAPGN